MKTGDLLLMSMKFSCMSQDISSTRLSQKNLHQMCSKNAQRMQNNMGAALSFLECCHREGDEFLDHIIAGDESWISHNAPESKWQSQEWHHANFLTKKNSSRNAQLQKLCRAFLFSDRKDVLLVDLFPRGEAINADAYYTTLKRP
jgi:hypothetical protein